MQAQLPWSGSGSITAFLLTLDWARDAACKDVAEEEIDRLFFPERGHGANAARKLCRTCLVREECLQYALGNGDASAAGVWGGTTPKERRKCRGSRRRAADLSGKSVVTLGPREDENKGKYR
jgi:hypothetical protein